ncbi:hypothetical protein [uncultured Alsobacter sp.]|uniref:hypothetical protein n=1 Tax=uncultured Alsobacter sp. TaxID=1748258 RepID=UPI0025FB7133|nr:hypothetical protein [uncultured Alsobacter sp.]
MKALDPANLSATKASDRKALAILAYDMATDSPETANWRAVADMLRAALPAARKVKADEPLSSWAPWIDAPLGRARNAVRHVATFTFADGETVHAGQYVTPGKPFAIAKAARVAIEFYRCRIRSRVLRGEPSEISTGWGALRTDYQACCDHVNVPDFARIDVETLGLSYDPAVANAETDALRWGAFHLPDVEALADEVDDNHRARFILAHWRAEGYAWLASRDLATWPEAAEDARGKAAHWRDVASGYVDAAKAMPAIPAPPLRRPLPLAGSLSLGTSSGALATAWKRAA